MRAIAVAVALLAALVVLVWATQSQRGAVPPAARVDTSVSAEPQIDPPVLAGHPDTPPDAEADEVSRRVGAENEGVSVAPTPLILRGRVVDSLSGEAIDGAQVIVTDARSYVALRSPQANRSIALTGLSGRYELSFAPNVIPERLWVTALAVGYRQPNCEGRGWWLKYAERWDPHRAPEKELDFVLKPGLAAGGVVEDERGQPISDVRVRIFVSDTTDRNCREQVYTDQRGRFHAYSLPRREELGDDLSPWPLELTHPQHLKVGIDDIYELSDSARESLRIVMRRGLELTGTLVHEDGSAAKSTRIHAVSDVPGSEQRSAETDVDGNFTLEGVRDGPITLRVLTADPPAILSREVPTPVDGQVLHLRLDRIEDVGAVVNLLGVDWLPLPSWVADRLGCAPGSSFLSLGRTEKRHNGLGLASSGRVLLEIDGRRPDSVRGLAEALWQGWERDAVKLSQDRERRAARGLHPQILRYPSVPVVMVRVGGRVSNTTWEALPGRWQELEAWLAGRPRRQASGRGAAQGE